MTISEQQFAMVQAMEGAYLNWKLALMACHWAEGCGMPAGVPPIQALTIRCLRLCYLYTQTCLNIEDAAIPAETEVAILQLLLPKNGSERGAFGVAWDEYHNRRLEACWAIACERSIPPGKRQIALWLEGKAFDELVRVGAAQGVQVGGLE